jgi:hypothetical protein
VEEKGFCGVFRTEDTLEREELAGNLGMTGFFPEF